jgi:hypothetical protein
MTDHRPATDRDHLSADILADLLEGLLGSADARRAEEHLRDCARCTADRLALTEVSGLLADAPDVGPVPDDVAERLDTALAAERRGTAAAVTVTPLAAPRPAFGMRVLQAAAVLVLLLAGAGLAVTAIQGGGGERSTSEAGGVAADAASPQSAAAFPVTASGRNWSQETLPEAVPQLVDGSLAPPVPKDATAGDGSAAPEAGASRELADNPVGRLAGGPDLANCVTALGDGPVTPLAVDLASWQGSPAAVVVLPTPDDPSTVDAWVVDPDCAQADAKVLYFARVARP